MHYHVLNNSIVLNYLGKTVVVSKEDSRYEPVLQCIRENRLDDIPPVAEIEKAFEGTGMELRDGILYTQDQPIPPELNARILQYKEQGIPYDSLLLFWENLKLNPSYNARLMLFNFLTHNGHPLTEDGCFIAYRGVTTDFKDVHIGKFNNAVGAVCEMARELVDDNPNNTCSSGLHVACFDYAKGFGAQLIEVKVNPRDVVAVPTDYNGTKMRTCRFEVVAVGENLRTEALYGHAPSENTLSDEDEDENLDDENQEEFECNNCGADREYSHKFCPECGSEYDV
jgi:hypothetical protein